MQLKNGCLEVLEFVALFVLKNGNLPLEEFFVDAIIALLRIDWFRKERDKYKVSLINGSSIMLPRSRSIKLFLLYCELYSP